VVQRVGVGVLARRFDATGAPIDAKPFLVASPAESLSGLAYEYAGQFQVTADGDEFFLSWAASPGFAGVRVGADGTVRDATPLVLPGAVIAAGGGQFLALSADMQFALLDASGRRWSRRSPSAP
jgi:hypothetical protein